MPDRIETMCMSHGPVDSGAHFAAGDVFGEWRLTAFIGRGGSGEVYCARHVRLGIPVALKVLMRDDGRAKARFAREARLLAEMRSMSFPRFFAYGEANGRAYLALELLEPCELPGEDMEVAKFLLRVCDGVAELHAMGIVHRDIKPGNILWRRGESGAATPVIADLGLAKEVSAPAGGRADSITLVDGRRAGVGTPGYGAPEQMERGEATVASDVHALGVLADRCFGGNLPGRWRRIVQRATSSIPSHRYSGVPAFRRAIRLRNAWRWLGAAAAVACVAAAGTWAGLAMRPYKYCVVDLSGGPDAKAYPVEYLKTEPPGWTEERGWSDEYKTSKLVLRRMERGSFLMGVADDSDESRSRLVKFDRPFYIGVFEVTQRQCELVTGGNPSVTKGVMRPVENMSWVDMRGWWEQYNWPGTSDVDSNSFIGRLRARTGLHFDLPTETQWEYACRAGTTSPYNDGGSGVDSLRRLARFAFNQKLRGWSESDGEFARHEPDGRARVHGEAHGRRVVPSERLGPLRHAWKRIRVLFGQVEGRVAPYGRLGHARQHRREPCAARRQLEQHSVVLLLLPPRSVARLHEKRVVRLSPGPAGLKVECLTCKFAPCHARRLNPRFHRLPRLPGKSDVLHLPGLGEGLKPPLFPHFPDFPREILPLPGSIG